MPARDRDASRSKIAESAKDTLIQSGLTDWTVDKVAARARCAKGLVLYHFQTKAALLEEVATRLLAERIDRRLSALEAGGSKGLDRLWRILEEDVASGISRLWLTLSAQGHFRSPSVSGHRSGWTRVSRSATKALQLSPGADPGETILDALNGFELALVQGRSPDEVREAYDRYWLGFLCLER